MKQHTSLAVFAKAVVLVGALATCSTGCIAPGQSKATSVQALQATESKVAKGASSGTEPVVIEISVGNTPTPFLWLEQENKLENYYRASARDQAAVMKKRLEQLKPSVQTNLWAAAVLQAEAGLAAERLQLLTEVYHGLELVHALRTEFPGARVILTLRDEAELKVAMRQFAKLTQPQGISLNLPNAPLSPKYPWGAPAMFGTFRSAPTADSPAGILVEFDLRRAGDANSALDAGGTFGRILNAQIVARASGSPEPLFLSGANERLPRLKSVMERAPASTSRVKQDRLGYDPEWLESWFGSAPPEAEWKRYQTAVRARALEYAKDLGELRNATLFSVERDQLGTNLNSAAQSPFLPAHTAISRRMIAALPLGTIQAAQDQRIQAWAKEFDPAAKVGRSLLDPAQLAVGSKERTLASFLNAELRLRERLTDLLMEEQYAGELGSIIRGAKEEEERVASKIKNLRGTAIAISIVGAAVGAGAAVAAGTAASAGNLAASQTAQSAINSMNSTVNAAIIGIFAAASNLNARSATMASNLAGKIGPIQVEIAGETQSIQAGSVGELRASMKALYAQHYPTTN